MVVKIKLGLMSVCMSGFQPKGKYSGIEALSLTVSFKVSALFISLDLEVTQSCSSF